MAVGAEAQLPRIGRPVFKSLCLCLQHQIIFPFQTPDLISAESDLGACQFILRRMIDIRPRYRYRLRRLIMVQIRLDTVRIPVLGNVRPEFFPFKIKIIRDKLIFSFIFCHDACLPLQKISRKPPQKSAVTASQSCIAASSDIRKLLPAMDRIAPVVQIKRPVQRLCCHKLFFQIFHKHLLRIFSAVTVVLCLIINLKADDSLMPRRMLHQFPDHALRMKPERRVHDIHKLSCPVKRPPAFLLNHDLRFFQREPGRQRIGRCPDHNGHSLPFCCLQNSVDMGKIIPPVLRFQAAPGRFCDPQHIHPCPFHHRYVFFQSVIRHIFRIICRPEQ